MNTAERGHVNLIYATHRQTRFRAVPGEQRLLSSCSKTNEQTEQTPARRWTASLLSQPHEQIGKAYRQHYQTRQ